MSSQVQFKSSAPQTIPPYGSLDQLRQPLLELRQPLDDDDKKAELEPGTIEQKTVILVVGATGGTGQAVVNCLLKRKFAKNQIRLLARTPASAKKLFGEGVDILQGNVADLDAVKAAIVNVTHVFYLTGPSLKDSREELEQCLVGGLRNIVNEGKRLGTLKHIILLSAVAIEWPYHPRMVLLNTFAPGLWAAHVSQERILRLSGLNYTIVRPPRLGPHDIQPEEVTISNGKCQRDYVSRAAVGEFMGRCVDNPILPAKVTLKIWGDKTKNLTEDFNWNTLFSSVESDVDDIPPNFEKRHIYAKRRYFTGLVLIISAIILLFLWRCGVL